MRTSGRVRVSAGQSSLWTGGAGVSCKNMAHLLSAACCGVWWVGEVCCLYMQCELTQVTPNSNCC
jgi:hypothetical protein